MSMSSPQIAIHAQIAREVGEYLEAMLAEPLAIRGQQLRGGGPIAGFEMLLAERCGFPYCVATSNATTALLALALLLRVRDRLVLFPENHWEGSVSAFRVFGAKIKRYDPDDAFNCADAHGEPIAIITGVIPQKFSTPRQTLVIEDSCRIPGLSASPKHVSPADIQVLSFGPGKPLSLGEGGAALFRLKSVYRKFIAVTQHPERMAAQFSMSAAVPRLSLNGRIHPVAALLGHTLLTSH